MEVEVFTVTWPGASLFPLPQTEEENEGWIILTCLPHSLHIAATGLNLYKNSKDIDLRSIHPSMKARDPEWVAFPYPYEYISLLPGIHAHTVLSGLAAVRSLLRKLSSNPSAPPGVLQAYEKYEQALPGLYGVRNSSQHLEDRVRRKSQNDKPIPGNYNIIAGLFEDKLTYTGTDGIEQFIEVSTASVSHARDAIQAALDAYTWRGSPVSFPWKADR